MCMVTTIITLSQQMMVNIMKASLHVFIPAFGQHTSSIRTLDGMVCIGSEIAFQTEHPLLWGAGVIYVM